MSIEATADDDIISKLEQAIIAEWSKQGVGAIDPAAIIAIIQAILAALGVCGRTPAQIQALMQNPTLLVKLVMTNQVTKALTSQFGPGAFFTHGGATIVKVISAVGKVATVENYAALARVAI